MAHAQATASSPKPEESVLHLVELLRNFDAATLVTRCRDGNLHGRPMSIAQVEDNATVWFVTSIGSAKVEEVSHDARAMVTLQSAARFVCLNGKAELVFDPQRIRDVWRDAYRLWYDSEADPDIVLVKFTGFDAEYWDKSGLQGLKQAFEAARAYVTGHKLTDKPELANDVESHAQIRLWDPMDQVEPIGTQRSGT